ncbi:hypothetical protein [Leeuwenhoekiella marinoflava]|uniref:Uncharacterized protein n=2 Tax=Leeuwenhoekiella marinoflava TaxID=988 RepID=A0A4Q0PN88_9FLAO|nr:hypothetical protein [Leeuwenhoekiella marinoflava]RXG32009.1 hypothetical protein DSL99_1312 [Leeuwenhoekiella marinoflava]SHE94840.1 hypothetical protein SAMN02745246_01369 [Leeuwenhoekiella marinoflava DSM 3653]
MILSKFFKNTNNLDKDLERNLLFSPNYLIREQKSGENRQFVLGGHSIITIEQINGSHKGLYFDRTRTSKSNKLDLDPKKQLHLGFQTLDDTNYLILGTRQKLTEVKAGDTLNITFKNEQKVTLTLEAGSKLSVKNKNYSCNLRTKLSKEELQLFKTRLIQSYKFISKSIDSDLNEDFDKEFSRKFREVAQSYVFCLDSYY